MCMQDCSVERGLQNKLVYK